MNIPTTLADELKLYLKQQAKNGDLEAQTLLSQIEQVPASASIPEQQATQTQPPDGLELGC